MTIDNIYDLLTVWVKDIYCYWKLTKKGFLTLTICCSTTVISKPKNPKNWVQGTENKGHCKGHEYSKFG